MTTLATHHLESTERPRRISSGIGVVRIVLTTITVLFLSLFVVLPAANVFKQAFANGWDAYRNVFFPPPIDQKRLTEIETRLDEINSLPLLKRRPFQDERRSLMREQSAILAAPVNAEQNWASVRLTLVIAAVVVPLNVIFGIAFAWAVTKFRFKGRSLLVAITELPFSVSPVVSGLVFVLLFGAQGLLADLSKSQGNTWLAPAVYGLRWVPIVLLVGWMVMIAANAAVAWRHPEIRDREDSQTLIRRVVLVLTLLVLAAVILQPYTQPNPGWGWLLPTDWKWPDPTSLYWRGFSAGHWWPIGAAREYEGVIFTPLAITLASIFVTFPFVARTLIPLMEVQGAEAEQAALTLGAGGWYTFRRVTLPSIKWGLLYGAILCSARALGEFGAVSVVSGHLDANDTMPLRIEKLWQAYRTQPAFTVASLLACTAVLTLVLKTFVEWMSKRGTTDVAVTARPGH